MVSCIVYQICCAIAKNFSSFLKFPSTADKWLGIAQKLENKCQFPICIGDIYGKHIIMHPPASSSSYYFKYKHTYSVALLVVVGPDYECIYAGIGTTGRVSEGGIWDKCTQSQKIESGETCFPAARCISEGAIEKFPHFSVSDEAFD